MLQPTFAKRTLNKPLQYGVLKTNNILLDWMAKQQFEYRYAYCHHKSNMYIRIISVGWMMFTNNALHPGSLYLMMIVINKPRKGHGTKQMEMLKRFSDDTGIPISLMPVPMKDSEPVRLNNFYERLGFKKEERFYVYEKMEAVKKVHQA